LAFPLDDPFAHGEHDEGLRRNYCVLTLILIKFVKIYEQVNYRNCSICV
jgi:hypothetical protein